MKTKILFEDKDIIVCVKPSGIISQSGEGESMISLLNKHFLENVEKSQAYPVHRLDRETAGVMVYAKNSKSAAALSRQIEQNAVKKHYYAVVKGAPEEKCGVLKDLLFRDKQKNKSYTVKRMRKGVREASLQYEVIGENGGFSMLDILLHTGRTHPIRVQFSSRKMPLYGDGRYGGGGGNLALFAHTLEFSHPVSGEKLAFSDKPDMSAEPWNMF
ncbi:MAG: RluA family pseudouridine synthase [Clostridia bacterium]|nr:RluA family pseudouridine synthase [Clostridia bacterium]